MMLVRVTLTMAPSITLYQNQHFEL